MTDVKYQKIDLAKIVASPTENSWAQAYNAGKLYAVISLSNKKGEEDLSLSSIGKECITALESEFFPLEEKNLTSIEEVAKTVYEKVPENIDSCIILATLVENILYIVTTKNGKVLVKRGTGFGIVTQEYNTNSPFTAFSGYVQDGDRIVLATKNFFDTFPESTISKTLENNNPSQVAETLMPLIHKTDDGTTAVLILFYLEETTTYTENDNESPPVEPEAEKLEINSYINPEKTKRSFPFNLTQVTAKKITKRFSLRFKKLLFLIFAVILILILVANAVKTLKNQQANKYDTIFNKAYPQAQKDFEQGQSLADLNASLSRNSFLQAQTEIKQNINKLPKNSMQWIKLNNLLQQVQSALSVQAGGTSVNATEISLDQNPLLEQENDQNALSATEDGTNVYLLLQNGISSYDKGTQKNKQIIDKSWTSPGGIGTYTNNIYVVDKNDGIIKFVSNGTGYDKTTYLTSGQSPDLSKAVSLAIDGSLWVLKSDGSIMKFTRGQQESFNITGLQVPFKNPTRIFTNENTNNLYILDSQNSRIVIFDKTGAFKQSFQSDVLKNASDFTVSEQDKKIIVLTGNKLYEIDIM